MERAEQVSKPTHRRKQATYKTKAPPKQPKSPPVDMSELCTLYNSKYEMTFYGADKAECEAKLAAFDAKRGGERIMRRGILSARVMT